MLALDQCPDHLEPFLPCMLLKHFLEMLVNLEGPHFLERLLKVGRHGPEHNAGNLVRFRIQMIVCFYGFICSIRVKIGKIDIDHFLFVLVPQGNPQGRIPVEVVGTSEFVPIEQTQKWVVGVMGWNGRWRRKRRVVAVHLIAHFGVPARCAGDSFIRRIVSFRKTERLVIFFEEMVSRVILFICLVIRIMSHEPHSFDEWFVFRKHDKKEVGEIVPMAAMSSGEEEFLHLSGNGEGIDKSGKRIMRPMFVLLGRVRLAPFEVEGDFEELIGGDRGMGYSSEVWWSYLVGVVRVYMLGQEAKMKSPIRVSSSQSE
ncbi:hypothetical protein LXL04_007820 [Taraxacum kok-saghyz]